MTLIHDGNTFRIGVTISPPPLQRLTFFEYCASKIGPPQRVFQLCNAIQIGGAGFCIVYSITWGFLIGEAATKTLGLSAPAAFVFSMAWIPVMSLQLIATSLRFGALTLLTKQAEQMAEAATTDFFTHIGACVAETLERFNAERDAAKEKPTLQ